MGEPPARAMLAPRSSRGARALRAEVTAVEPAAQCPPVDRGGAACGLARRHRDPALGVVGVWLLAVFFVIGEFAFPH
jgi:hypothetical protein